MRTRTFLTDLFALTAFVWALGTAQQAGAFTLEYPTIDAGNWTIAPAPNQSIDLNTSMPIAIKTTGSAEAAFGSLDLALEVSAGGPQITTVDLLSGVFLGNNTGQTDLFLLPSMQQYSSTTVQSGLVGPAGDLAYVSFDGTGVAPGTYSFLLANSAGTSAVAPQGLLPPGSLIYGTITVVPEPASLVLAFSAVACLAALAVHRHRARMRRVCRAAA